MATIHDLADTFTVSSPRETTGMNWWADEGEHEDLQIEEIPLDQFDWQALASLPSVPIHPLLATVTESDIMAHAEEPTASLCARLTEASDVFWALRGPIHDTLSGPRYEIVDDGLLIVDGRAWQQALIKAPAADVQPLLDHLADNPGCLIVDEWDEDRFEPGLGADTIAAQVALPFTAQARTWLDGLAEDLVIGPPRSRPARYLVAPATTQTRIMALTPIHEGAALRAVLTVRDEDSAHLVAAVLNQVLANPTMPHLAHEAHQIATSLLSPSSARAVDTEITAITIPMTQEHE